MEEHGTITTGGDTVRVDCYTAFGSHGREPVYTCEERRAALSLSRREMNVGEAEALSGVQRRSRRAEPSRAALSPLVKKIAGELAVSGNAPSAPSSPMLPYVARGAPIQVATNEWYKAQQLAETYWLYVVWDPLGESPELVRIQNPAVKLDHAKREVVAARYFEIAAEAISQAHAKGGLR